MEFSFIDQTWIHSKANNIIALNEPAGIPIDRTTASGRSISKYHRELLNYALNPKNVTDGVSVVGHLYPDGDAIGSVLAFMGLLKLLGHTYVRGHFVNPIPDYLEPIIDYAKAHGYDIEVIDADGKHDTYNTVFQIDSFGRHRMGAFASPFMSLIAIDHHKAEVTKDILNKGNYDLAWIDATYPSASCMVYEMIFENGNLFGVVSASEKYERIREISTFCYLGLLTDTGGFKHSNTGKEAFLHASAMAANGADVAYINNIYHYTGILKDTSIMQEAIFKFANFIDYEVFENFKLACLVYVCDLISLENVQEKANDLLSQLASGEAMVDWPHRIPPGGKMTVVMIENWPEEVLDNAANILLGSYPNIDLAMCLIMKPFLEPDSEEINFHCSYSFVSNPKPVLLSDNKEACLVTAYDIARRMNPDNSGGHKHSAGATCYTKGFKERFTPSEEGNRTIQDLHLLLSAQTYFMRVMLNKLCKEYMDVLENKLKANAYLAP